MGQVLEIKRPLLVAVTDGRAYVAARKEADDMAKKDDLTVLDMPMTIVVMDQYPKARELIRSSWIDTITAECHGQRDGESSYEVWHSAGSLATEEELAKAFPNAGVYAFMEFDNPEWVAVGKGDYNGQTIARVRLDDLRKGSVPVAGTPYTTHLTIPDGYELIPLNANMKDVLVAQKSGKLTIFERGQLSADQFQIDDRVLSVLGSPHNVMLAHKMLFGKTDEGGEGHDSIGSYHKIKEVGFDAKAKRRLVYLGNGNVGLLGGLDIYCIGRFGGVSAGGAVRAATLEQTISIINSPELNREGMIKAVYRLHGR